MEKLCGFSNSIYFIRIKNFAVMKLQVYLIIACLSVCVLPVSSSFGQGCVAVRNMSSCHLNFDSTFTKGLQVSLNYRYFRSYKHFVGSHEETHRVERGTEVINNDNSVNLALVYSFNDRWSASVIIPYLYIDRSSMYEHLGNSFPGQLTPNVNNPEYKRFVTHSEGLGDIRVLAYYNALKKHHTNLTVGMGFKLPTGDYRATDTFYKPEGPVEGVVDQSMQPGDGGLGNIIDVDFNQTIFRKWGIYANAMYMLNPRNTNGVKRSPNLTRDSNGDDIPLSNEFSVADQYLVRLGARFTAGRVQAALGGRMECIPSKDLIGKSDGFRRPGYIISAEPSVNYSFGKHTIGMNFPIALERNRTRSQIDIARGINPRPIDPRTQQPTSPAPYHGDAAFADWLLSVTYSYRISLR
jgi:hypothetical protein